MLDVKEILSNLDRKEVIYKAKKKPTHFSSDLEENRWYAKIIELCHTGDKNQYGLEIPGSLVFMSNFTTIYNRITGAKEETIVRDVDYVLHYAMAQCMKEGKWLLNIKGRNIGYSIDLVSKALYFMLMDAGCTINFTSCDQERLNILFNKVFIPMLQGLPKKIRPDELSRENNKAGVGLILGVNTIDMNGEKATRPTTFRAKPTAHNPTAASAFSGAGNRFAGIDEFFLNKNSDRVAGALLDASRDKKTNKLLGFVQGGGTLEASISGDQLKEYARIWSKADQSNVWNKLFLPSWLGYGVQENKGHSDYVGAMEWWEQEYEAYRRSGNEEKLNEFLKNNCTEEKHIFDLASSDRFEPDVAQLAKIQYEEVLKMKDNIWVPTFLKNTNNTIESIPVAKSPLTILEQPKPSVPIWIVVDNIGKGSDIGSTDGSKYSAMAVKGHDPNGKDWQPIMHYYERPKTLEEAFMQTLNMAIYCNKHGNLEGIAVEANSNMEYFGVFFRKMGFYHLILNARDLSGKGYINTKKIGQNRTKETERFQYNWANPHFRKYISSITLLPLLEDMLTDADVNADSLDSYLQLAGCLDPDYDKPIEKKKPIRRAVFFNENGKTGWRIEQDRSENQKLPGIMQTPIQAGSIIEHRYNATPQT